MGLIVWILSSDFLNFIASTHNFFLHTRRRRRGRGRLVFVRRASSETNDDTTERRSKRDHGTRWATGSGG